MGVEGARQIQHFSHEHDLILSNEELMKDELCDGCVQLISTPFYSCTQCNFLLHSRCAQLPRNKWHPLHPHSLILISIRSKYYFASFSCKACQRLSNGFSYVCGTCYFGFDLQCCSIPKTMKHEGHQHSLSLAVDSNRRCHVCNVTSNDKPCMLVCTYCDFALGFECATLPLEARHKDDDHLLKLTYNAEAYCEEYYCLICEKKRDPKQWFYYCTECDFPAHSQCVLGKYPCIKFGSTFTSKDYHWLPSNFVPET
ncbi:protein VACUOLELESS GAMETOPHYTES-like [Corylus avellana]|uniref:protein VACUOLELESS GAMETOPHYTES-like n=1 Tax=Corylus avellana TaxID=13451 RepID=UPI00286AE1AF|nr:protein VACUOLELESS GAMETOPHYTES-like [Corylus avellana]